MSDVRLGFVGVVVEDQPRGRKGERDLILLRRNDPRTAWACPIRRRAMR